jgi:hypothetical protein
METQEAPTLDVIDDASAERVNTNETAGSWFYVERGDVGPRQDRRYGYGGCG